MGHVPKGGSIEKLLSRAGEHRESLRRIERGSIERLPGREAPPQGVRESLRKIGGRRYRKVSMAVGRSGGG